MPARLRKLLRRCSPEIYFTVAPPRASVLHQPVSPGHPWGDGVQDLTRIGHDPPVSVQSSPVKPGAWASRVPPTLLRHGGSCFYQRHPHWQPAAWGAHAPRIAGHGRERASGWLRQTRPEQARRESPTTRSVDRARNSCQLMGGAWTRRRRSPGSRSSPAAHCFETLWSRQHKVRHD
jgi:hypothetical protein